MADTPQVIINFPGTVPGGLCFRNPRAVISAGTVADVLQALSDVSKAVAEGMYAAGYLSYEAAPAFDSALEVLAPTRFPLLWFGLFDAPVECGEPSDAPSYSFSEWRPDVSRSSYRQSFNRVHEAITRGDTYQVNTTFRLRANFDGDSLSCYRGMLAAHPAAYGAYIDTGEFSIVSLSPELLVDVDGNHVCTRPMKGTIRRGRWSDEDLARAQWLSGSAKDRAENVMIVDLMRNDFGKIARPGSVVVPKLFEVEPLASVWQMTSTVECDIDSLDDIASVLSAVFPAGSITGAPKPMAMRIITQVEQSPRNIYCGTIGYAAPHRRAVFNVAIRTVLIDNKTGAAECGVGGGITADSSCDAEFEEAMAKSLFLNATGEPFSLLETLRLEAGAYFLLDRHRDRLAKSAAYFGFAVDTTRVSDALATFACEHPAELLRVRLTVAKDGPPTITSTPHAETAIGQRIALAKRSINTDSAFVFNKTTRREHYAQIRSDIDDDGIFDVLMWNERGEITEFTTGNFVVRIGEMLYTPPIECGLLPGTFRAELIETGQISERVIRRDVLEMCSELWFINSVRRWVRVWPLLG